MNRLYKYLLIFSLLLYLISLTQDTYSVNNEYVPGNSPGFLLVLTGWLGVFFGGADLCWLANPFIVFSWIFAFSKKEKLSFVFSTLAVIASCSFFLFDEILANEAGQYGKITNLHIGYYLWTASCIAMFIGNLYQYCNRHRSE